MKRRTFLGLLGCAGAVSTLAQAEEVKANATHTFPYYPDSYGVLHDTTRCIGCRRCEMACNEINNLPKPAKSFEDQSVFNKTRRTDDKAWTVVNKYNVGGKTVYRKLQCFHCNDPACASACFAKCFHKEKDGSVSYNGDHCVGCRYCMIACPFYVPGFQYDEAFDPLVQKCTFCKTTRLDKGLLPACVSKCPMDALTFGRRADLIKIAHKRIEDNPGKYVDYIYGEWDAGGTAWMVLSPAPTIEAARATPSAIEAGKTLHQLGLDTHLGNDPMAEYTYGALGTVPMIIAFWPILFGGAYAMSKRREAMNRQETEDMKVALDSALKEIESSQGAEVANKIRTAIAQKMEHEQAVAEHHTHNPADAKNNNTGEA